MKKTAKVFWKECWRYQLNGWKSAGKRVLYIIRNTRVSDWMYTRRMSIKVTIMWKCRWNGKRLLEKGAGTIRVRWIWNYYCQGKIIQNFQTLMSFLSVILIRLEKKNTAMYLRCNAKNLSRLIWKMEGPFYF